MPAWALRISTESLTFSAILELRSKRVALKDQRDPLSYSDAHGAKCVTERNVAKNSACRNYTWALG
jgi:hypothetical protein